VTTAFLILLVFYLLKILLFHSGAVRATRPNYSGGRPSVSVIVAARNEEANIDRCLQGLAQLTYDAGEMEIILVDDQSTDRTAERIEPWAERLPHLKMMRTEGALHGLRGKANAIAQAIEKSSGEIILTTDADCLVAPSWVEDTIAQYDESTGCVCGMTLIEHDSVFTGMQALDWTYLLTIASAGVGWGYSLSAVGNNMSFRRQAYEDVGGYQGVGFSVTEDFILFKAISYQTDWIVRYPVSASTLVWSKPCVDFRELYRQKKRWGRGGLDIHPIGFAIMSIGFLMNAGIIVLPFLGLPLWAWLAGVAGKFIGDAFLLSFPLRKLRQHRLFRYFLIFEIYYLIYVTLLPFVVLLGGRVVWKDRKL
jgi:cellulose synthase/poly-beta-1,6-N-acetylglucosamine synthase-like glycosyltransferase